MKPLMETLDWRECGYYLVADVAHWRVTVTRGKETGSYLATWSQRNLPRINLPVHAAQGDTVEEAVRLVLASAKDSTQKEISKLREFMNSMEEFL